MAPTLPLAPSTPTRMGLTLASARLDNFLHVSVIRTSVRCMRSGAPADPEAIIAAVDRFEAARADLAALSFDALTAAQALTLKDRLETLSRRQAAVDHRLTHQLTSQLSPVELGATLWTDVLSNRLRIGRGEARRRLDEADDLGPRTAHGRTAGAGPPNVAAAQAAGTIGAEHVRIVRRFFADLPAAVDIDTRQACEAHLARHRRRTHPRRVTQGRRPADGAGAPLRRLQRRRPGPDAALRYR